ncbi:MAG: immunoglobulin-like domain-containing protein [Clostridium paraputrificum]
MMVSGIVPFKDNVAFIEIGIILKPKSNNNENIKLDTCFGELKKGKYRIVKEFYKDEEKKKVFVEFSL